MHRYTRITLALLLSTGATLTGATVTANAEQSSSKHRLVQQTDQSAQQQQDNARSQIDQARDRAGGAMNRAQDQASQMGSQAQQAMQGGSSQQVAPGQLPTGFTVKDYGNARGEVTDTLASVVKSALTKDNYNDLIDNFAQADRDRLKTSDNSYPPDLNQTIDKVRGQWQSKYNTDFAIDKNAAFADQFLSVTTGQVSNAEQIQNWPLTLSDKWAKQYGKPSMNKDTAVGVAHLSGTPDQSTYNISLIREGREWKIDIPDTVSADKLKANLSKHLNEVSAMTNQWPQDQAQAQRAVTTHVLQALYDVDVQQQGGGQMGAGQSGQTEQSGQPPQSQHEQHGQQPQSQSQQGQSGQSGEGAMEE